MKFVILLVILLPIVISKRKEMAAVCHAPMKEGIACLSKILMYYYDAEYQLCRPFFFRGCGGNNNRFSSKEECEKECGEEEEEEEEEEKHEDDYVDKCTLPVAKGICHNNIMRYYYDFETGKCKAFIYTGCFGNANNFDTLIDCAEACEDGSGLQRSKQTFENFQRFIFIFKGTFLYINIKRKTRRMKLIVLLVILLPVVTSKRKEMDPVCYEPMKEGKSCLPKVPMYYYDPEYKMCRQFYYGGCWGNKNRFNSIEECEERCGEDEEEEEEKEESHEDDYVDKCTLPMAKGICHRDVMRYYYDFNTNSCKAFIYTGCAGNANNFESILDCEEQCLKE
ncbi:papilin [Trichonephila clavata]|uniref:Papilin n=1 Tax=Trichonephila clavata TaxID=2740835 RepID=A0A8X6HS20_TRICU|nr:papilin [Trichonephila clavata]